MFNTIFFPYLLKFLQYYRWNEFFDIFSVLVSRMGCCRGIGVPKMSVVGVAWRRVIHNVDNLGPLFLISSDSSSSRGHKVLKIIRKAG